MTWEQVLALASGAVAGVSLATLIVQAIASIRRRDREKAILSKTNPLAAIESDSLAALGYLFVDRLGATSIAGYSRDSSVKSEFRELYGIVSNYVELDGPGEDFLPPSPRPGGQESQTHNSDARSSESPIAQRAMEDVAAGETWNGLARMRRAVERILVEKLAGAGFKSARAGASQLLAVASQAELLPQLNFAAVRKALATADRGIHGRSVSAEEAIDAIQVLDRAIVAVPGADETLDDSERPRIDAREVTFSPSAGWEVRRSGTPEVIATARSMDEAMVKARESLGNAVDGEVRVLSRHGRTSAVDNVIRKPDRSEIQIYIDRSSHHRFRYVSSVGEVLMVSEAYGTRAGAKAGAENFLENVRNADEIELAQ